MRSGMSIRRRSARSPVLQSSPSSCWERRGRPTGKGRRSGGDDGIVVVDRATLEILGTVRPDGILGAGRHIATDSRGNLYVAATGAGMQKLTFRGMSGAQ